jgi:hypothetical protein
MVILLDLRVQGGKSAGTMLYCARFATTYVPRYTNIIQTLYKHYTNIIQTLYKHYTNIIQTLYKHYAKYLI